MNAGKLRDKLTKLFALLGSENANERENARVKILELLAKNKNTWNDLTELLQTGDAQGWQDDSEHQQIRYSVQKLSDVPIILREFRSPAR